MAAQSAAHQRQVYTVTNNLMALHHPNYLCTSITITMKICRQILFLLTLLPDAQSSFVSRSLQRNSQSTFKICISKGNAFQRGTAPLGKGDLYDDDVLMDILTLHNSLNAEYSDELKNDAEKEKSIFGLHDEVLQTIEEISSFSSSPSSYQAIKTEKQEEIDNSVNNLMALLQEKKPAIRAIVSDVDGTLLSSHQKLHPHTLNSLLKAIRQSRNETKQKIQFFFLATGKSRTGALSSLGSDIGPLLREFPGVYIQGLYCVDGKDNILFEKRLPSMAIRAAENLAAEFGISIVGYDGDNLYSNEITESVIDLSEFYGEPTVELISSGNSDVSKLADHLPGFHKLLLIDPDTERLSSVIRPKLEQLGRSHRGAVTQAIPTMLEFLPEGCSKAFGVKKVCEALLINPESELLALGDAENDVGMLKMASIGVAVGNCCPKARSAADYIMNETNDEGGAGLAMELFGFSDS